MSDDELAKEREFISSGRYDIFFAVKRWGELLCEVERLRKTLVKTYTKVDSLKRYISVRVERT